MADLDPCDADVVGRAPGEGECDEGSAGTYAVAAATGRPAVVLADGDGRLEVLAMPPASARENRRVYCFEADGRLRFVHRPEGDVRFGDRAYAEPWLAHDVVVTEGLDGTRSLWAVCTHDIWVPARLPGRPL